MKKRNNISSLFGFLALASGSIWFGAYLARLLTTYNMFKETELVLKDFLNSSNLSAVIEILSPIIYLTLITYVIMILTFTLFLATTDLKFKQNGWLFITAAIIYVTLPFESFLLFIDYNMIDLFLKGIFGSDQIVDLLTKRLTKLSSFPIIMILSYLAIPFLMVFKPFTLKQKNED